MATQMLTAVLTVEFWKRIYARNVVSISFYFCINGLAVCSLLSDDENFHVQVFPLWTKNLWKPLFATSVEENTTLGASALKYCPDFPTSVRTA